MDLGNLPRDLSFATVELMTIFMKFLYNMRTIWKSKISFVSSALYNALLFSYCLREKKTDGPKLAKD